MMTRRLGVWDVRQTGNANARTATATTPIERNYRSDIEERGTADRRTRCDKRGLDRFDMKRRLP
jgi:hypothetical protein